MNSKKSKYYTAMWNPVDGCLNNCQNCRARAEAEKYGGHHSFALYMAQDEPIDTGTLRILDFPMRDELTGKIEAFPFMFSPTYHRGRLINLPSRERPENILVCGQGDLFGTWIEDWIVQEVFEYARSAPWHNYLFISKNPARYDTIANKSDNMLFGATIDSLEQSEIITASNVRSLDFLIINTIHIALNPYIILKELSSSIRWIIIGDKIVKSETDKDFLRDRLTAIAQECVSHDIPLFYDERLRSTSDDLFRQEYPQILKKNVTT